MIPLNAVAYDEVADYILRNNFKNDTVYIQGRVQSNLEGVLVNIKYIKKQDSIHKCPSSSP